MHLSRKIQKAIAENVQILAALKLKGKGKDWDGFTRTQFNFVARIINKQISREVVTNPDLVEMALIIGRQQFNNQLETLRCHNVYDFIKYLGNMGEYRVFNWISGKTLQSYWNGGEAKYVKINALLVFLQVPFNQWDEWQKETGKSTAPYRLNLGKAPVGMPGLSKSSISVIKSYFLGNYFLYYQKTDGSKNVIKTPFVLKENENGQVIVRSVSEGHRYSGKVVGIRDGCLYINCQNLDFEEMEQYVFNLGLETKPEVLFGVSNTVSVKNRQAVALKNILVKQKNNNPAFETIPEAEIPFSRYYDTASEEAIIVNYLKQSPNNIITTATCCNLDDIAGLARESA